MMKAHTYSKKLSTNDDKTNNNNNDVASSYGMPPPSNHNTASRLAQIDDMKLFFATATQQWEPNKSLKRFSLPAGESVSCVLWNDLFFITGTDIVRSLTFRFYAFGRPVTNAKKFEEGIFSDLRNLKPGHDARLEEPKSELLDMLYKNNCIRTQKKQKVFFWFSVPHDRLFLDALERDLKREKMGMEPTTHAVAEPAASLSLDSTQELFDQLRKSMSQSAAATAQAIEDDMSSQGPIPNTSLSLNHVGDFSSSTNNTDNWSSNHTPWSSSQSRLERAASQAKRSRVNSVPANIGQQQQFQLMQQKHHRMSHASYFSSSSSASSTNNIPTSRSRSSRHRRTSSSASSLLSNNKEDMLFHDDSSSTTSTTLTEMSKSALSSPIHSKFGHEDYLDPISHGVDQLEITASLSSHSTSTSSSLLSHNVLPSKSLDSNAMKKTKTIFGNLSLFDGSPTYKQRRRRAASVSSSALNPAGAAAGGPERVRRHDKCHLRTPSNTNHHHHHHVTPAPSNSSTNHNNIINSNSSRLAMAAVKAGFAPNQIIAPPTTMQMIQNHTTLMPTHNTNWNPQQQQQQVDYLCHVSNCGRLFKRADHLERHMNTVHTFICTLCGKQFPRPENLAQHHRLEHELSQHDHHASSMSGGDNNDDDSSPDDQRNYNNNALAYQRRQVLNHQGNNTNNNGTDGFYSSPRHSFDGSRSSGWSTGISGANSVSSSHCSSRCSTLSPMLDLDFDMPDIQPHQQQQQQQQRQQQQQMMMMNTPISSSRSNTSLTTTTDSSSSIIMNTFYPTTTSTSSTSDEFIKTEPPLYQQQQQQQLVVRTNSSSIEDDFSSSSASSPCSTLQLQYGGNINHDYQPTTSISNTMPMTLLSPFKPMNSFQQQQEMLFQQQQQMINNQQPVEDYPFVEDVNMLLPNEYSSYATYVDHHHQQQYTPSFITSPDNMNIVFGA